MLIDELETLDVLVSEGVQVIGCTVRVPGIETACDETQVFW